MNVSKIDIFKISYFPMLRVIVVTLELSQSQLSRIEIDSYQILCEWQKISSPTPVIEHIFGLSGPLFWSPPVQAVAHWAPAPVAGHAPCSHPEKLVPGPGAGARSERVIRPGTRPEHSITRMSCGSPPDESLQTRHFTSHFTQQPLTSSLSAHFTTLSWNMSSKQGG